ncbi:MAG TPA: hypothetical protein VK489_16735 [Ferruginibacter sp.]|nr:hypothetical protein [Ferruginibacter sp.]
MKKSITLYCCFIIACAITICSCNKKEKQALKESYPSGKLKKSGWVNKDNMPVDTMFYYFENGNPERIEVRDDSGRLNGVSKTFYENGIINQEISYVNNAIEGFIASYKENGRLSGRIHRVQERQLGDAYWFDETGKIYQYDFFGFGDDKRNYIKYDGAGNITEKIAPYIFMDSLSIYTPVNSEQQVYEVTLLLSNAPKTRTSVVINYLAKDSTVIKQDSITGKPYYIKKETFSKDVYNIRFNGRQYDSLTGKTLLQNMTRPVNE